MSRHIPCLLDQYAKGRDAGRHHGGGGLGQIPHVQLHGLVCSMLVGLSVAVSCGGRRLACVRRVEVRELDTLDNGDNAGTVTRRMSIFLVTHPADEATYRTPMLIAIATPTFSLRFILRFQRNVQGMRARAKSQAAEYAARSQLPIILLRAGRNVPPVPIQMLVPTPGAQQVPLMLPSQPFAIGLHWIHGTAALKPMAILTEMMMNQTTP